MKKDTLIIHRGRHPKDHQGIVNPPVYHASTVIFPTLAEYEDKGNKPFEGVRYGRTGTPTTFALEEAVTALYGGHKTIALSSGLAAISVTLTALLKSGDHLLIADNIYAPTRKRVADVLLARAGVETTYFDPGAGIEDFLRPKTKVLMLESPGSVTFEMLDVPKISAEAKKAGVTVVMDNTWATALFFQPFGHGVDIVVAASPKYIGGHADVIVGTGTVATAEQSPPV